MTQLSNRNMSKYHNVESKLVAPHLKPLCMALSIALLAISGCVERTISINSKPDNALVILNDQEIGRTPVKVDFTWYGDYDIILRKEGYQTIQTSKRIEAPWYQRPGIDLFTECFSPITYRDDRDFGTYELQKFQPATKQVLIKNAEELRARAGSPDATQATPSPEPTVQDIETPPSTSATPVRANPSPPRQSRPPADGVMRPINE